MADTFIQVAADSTGKKLDTRTEASNLEHRQVVVLGDPALNAGVAPVDATNGLSVNVTNASLTVGTHAVTQSGTFTVQPGNTANTTAWKVDGSAVTQPVSAASLPLPTGASTSSIQSETHGTVAAGTAATKSELIGGVFNTALPTLTNGQQSAAQFDSSGRLIVSIGAGAGSGGTALADESTFTQGTTSFTPVGGTYNTSITNLTAGQGGAVQLSNDRKLLTKAQVWDGTNAATIRAASTGAAATTDTAVVVTVRDSNSNGQTTMANSAPVAIASDQTLPLPTGASTSANQTSVIGTLAAGTSATNSLLTGGVFNTSAPTLTNGQQAARQVDSSGNQLVNLKTAIPAGSNVIGALTANQSVNLAQVAGATTAVGSGVQSTALRTTLATDSPGIITLGQTTKSASVPMTLASDQMGPLVSTASIPVVMTPPVASLGSYMMSLNSGTMAAGLSAASPIAAFRYGAANKALVKRIVISAGNAGTGFTAGTGHFDIFAARSFTVSDTGGTAATITGNNGKLATSYATTGISDFRVSSTATLTAGTRTLDATALASFAIPITATAGLVMVNPGTWLFDAEASMLPLILAQNEGFVIQATVPATGTWTFSVCVYWDEVSAF